MVENNREIEKSFNSFLIRRINSAKKDLFLIGKHSDIFKGNLNLTIKNNSKFYENLSSCLIDSSDINNSPFADKYNNISDKENPMISIVSDYLKNNIFNSESMIKDFVNNSLLNYVSYFVRNKNALNSSKRLLIFMLCFVPRIKAWRRSGIVMSSPMIASTFSLNLAGWAVSRKMPTSLGCSCSLSA